MKKMFATNEKAIFIKQIYVSQNISNIPGL